MRVQCGDGHWFTFPGPCPYGTPGDPCGYVPPDPEPPPPRVRESFDAQVAAPDRDALRVMADELGPVHADGFAAARAALAEATYRKKQTKGETCDHP